MRARAILVAWVLAAQVIAPSLALASTVRSGCCCAASEKRCHCPACSKTRSLEEGQDVAGACGHDDGAGRATSLLVAAPVRALLPVVPVATPPRPAPSVAPPGRCDEVPTPPPLG